MNYGSKAEVIKIMYQCKLHSIKFNCTEYDIPILGNVRPWALKARCSNQILKPSKKLP